MSETHLHTLAWIFEVYEFGFFGVFNPHVRVRYQPAVYFSETTVKWPLCVHFHSGISSDDAFGFSWEDGVIAALTAAC